MTMPGQPTTTTKSCLDRQPAPPPRAAKSRRMTVSDASRGTPPNGQPPAGGPRGREQEFATVRTVAGTQQAAQPRVASPSGPGQPRLAPNQTPPAKPLAAPGQPNGARPAAAQPSAPPTVEAMPPPAGMPTGGEQQPSRRPAVPVWDPPAAPGPKRSWKERLGLATKPDPAQQPPVAHRAAAPPTSSVPTVPRPVPTAPSGNGSGSGATGASSSDRPPGAAPAPDPTGTDPNGTSLSNGGATPLDSAGPPASPGGSIAAPPAPGHRAEGRPSPADQPTARTTGPGPMPAPAAPPGGPKTGVLPAVGAATAAAATAAVAAAKSGAERLSTNTKPKPGVARRTRKARLRLSRLDPWSVMKTSFMFSIAAGIMLVVAVYTVWTVLDSSGLFDSINDIVKSVVSTPGDTTPFRIQDYVNTQKVMGIAALIACVDVVIFTALATLGSFLYNLAATMLGGLEITLAED